jgi:DNA polymerase I
VTPAPPPAPLAAAPAATVAPPPPAPEVEPESEPEPEPLGPAIAAPPAPPPSPFAPRGQGSLDLGASGSGVASAAPAASAAPGDWVARLHEVRARALHGLGIVPVADGDDPRRATLVGLALGARDGVACYVPLAHEGGGNLDAQRVRDWLFPALADPTVPKVALDLKRAAHVLEGFGLALEGFDLDLRLASFLLDPERDHGLEALARDALGIALPAFEPRALAGARPASKLRPSFAALAPETVAAAALPAAAALFPLAAMLEAQLEAQSEHALYETLERPLLPVLLAMERAGVALDRGVLEAQRDRLGAEIARLEAELRALAGGEVNLDSGPQVARVLFETLKLKPGRRTKTGFSTDQAVLESLAPLHPFPARLLEYRTLTKLRSTWLDALPQQIDPRDGRVHTTFDPAGAATGRLSSSNPNLQNIPIRTEVGRAIRRAFVAAPGATLVGADYSQIELRVMAHLSGDPRLIEAFTSGEDVHAATARRVFRLGPGPVPAELRARAKVVNFGVMYGMGARSLAQQMGIALADAEAFIRDYFAVYARVREYLDATLEEARRRGYVTTLLGRRRPLPGLDSLHGGERSNAERAAINTPLQGSAADLMKLAMTRVHRALPRIGPSARLLLQVHDELLLECPAEEADAVSELVRTEMEGCYPLRVPLRVSTGTGATWFDVH